MASLASKVVAVVPVPQGDAADDATSDTDHSEGVPE
jgi:hypothetical protein